MNFGLWFTIGSLVFLIFLYVHYQTQEKRKELSLRKKIFVSLISMSIFYGLFEILSVFLIELFYVPIASNILFKVHSVIGYFWLYVSACYFEKLLLNKDDNTFKGIMFGSFSKKITFALVIVISAITVFHVDLPKFEGNYLFFFKDMFFVRSAITVIFSFIICSILFQYLYKEKNKNYKFIVVLFFYIIALSSAFFLSIIFPEISFFTLSNAFALYLLYYSKENPDIEIEEEMSSLSKLIEKSSSAKLDFLFNMSNDVKEAMNNMVGYGQSLRNLKSYDREKIRYYVNNIKFSGNSLVDSLNNILDISRIESGEEQLNLREYSMNDLLEDLPNVISFKIGERPIKFEMNIDQSISSALEGDPSKVLQIATNMLSNAVKYTEVGRIELRVTSVKEGDKEKITFRISDTGCGMKAEEINELNDRLNGGEANATTQDGLGLVIAKKYVELMGGRLWFESEFRSGSIFYAEIPQRVISPVPLSNVLKNVENNVIEYFDCSKYKLLVVEDDKLNAKVLTKLLNKYNFDITVVNSGKECINKIKAEEKYDMILLDHKMPEFDGLQTLEVLKNLETYELPPIVAITANVFIGVEEIYYRAGFNDYLAKPINIDDLNKLIVKYFKKDE